MTLIVAIAAINSLYFVSSVNDEVKRVADVYIPLSDIIDDIEVQALEQKILLERVPARLYAGDGAVEINQLRRDLKERNRTFQQEFETSLALLQQAQMGERIVDFKIKLERVTTQLEQVIAILKELGQQTEAILAVAGNREGEKFKDLLTARLKLDTEFSRQIAVITAEVHGLTRQAAHNAAQAETWALRANIMATAAAALLGLILAGFVSRGLVRPIHKLVAAAKLVEQGNLDPTLEVKSKDEIGDLSHAFEEMTAELRIKALIKDTFGKFVDPRVVETLTKGEHAGLSDGERQVYSVFFSDIAGFTSISEKLTPKALVTLINAYLTEMSEPIHDSSGVIDKYIGDAIMAYWGPPFTPADEHAQAACQTALKQQSRLIDFRKTVGDITGLRRDYPDISMRIGIATGDVLVGSVGSERTRNYTVIGDTVNLAARLESLGKHYGSEILVCETTWQSVREIFEFREIDTIAVAGKSEPVRMFELLAVRGDISPELAARRNCFQAALQHYRAGAWPEARQGFAECLARDAADSASEVMLARLETLEASPPADWDGVWHFAHK
ncbi:MAG: HAMP domain-containing protein [Rhodospirillaceae bacterium]|nr:HAMP domain-containing protein [Rhodospirillaceae bacterium]